MSYLRLLWFDGCVRRIFAAGSECVVVLRQKATGCLRTLTGTGHFCAIRSHLSTAAKQVRHFYDSLVMLVIGRPLAAGRDLTSCANPKLLMLLLALTAPHIGIPQDHE